MHWREMRYIRGPKYGSLDFGSMVPFIGLCLISNYTIKALIWRSRVGENRRWISPYFWVSKYLLRRIFWLEVRDAVALRLEGESNVMSSVPLQSDAKTSRFINDASVNNPSYEFYPPKNIHGASLANVLRLFILILEQRLQWPPNSKQVPRRHPKLKPFPELGISSRWQHFRCS